MDFQLKSDQDLIHLYIAGDEGGLVELIRRYQSKIYTSVYLLVKDEYLAEDIFQDTFIKVINTLRAGKYNEEGKFLPWIIRIAHNLVIDHFRKEKRTPMIATQDGFDIFNVIHVLEENIEDRIVREQTYTDIRKLIEKLPEEQ